GDPFVDLRLAEQHLGQVPLDVGRLHETTLLLCGWCRFGRMARFRRCHPAETAPCVGAHEAATVEKTSRRPSRRAVRPGRSMGPCPCQSVTSRATSRVWARVSDAPNSAATT